MKVYLQIVGLLTLLVGSTGVLAEKYDGSLPLLCAVTQTMGCDAVPDCVVGPADAVNLPIFLRFDANKKEVITAKGGDVRRTSKIQEVGKEGEVLVFVGFEPGGSWSATVDKATGKMTATVALNGHAYLFFGSCLVL